jgi:hypothetical protein
MLIIKSIRALLKIIVLLVVKNEHIGPNELFMDPVSGILTKNAKIRFLKRYQTTVFSGDQKVTKKSKKITINIILYKN